MDKPITNFRKVQVRTRGIIPVILKRGPLAEVELDDDTILELIIRGVEIYTIPDGHRMIPSDIINQKEASEPVVEEAVIEEVPEESAPVENKEYIPPVDEKVVAPKEEEPHIPQTGEASKEDTADDGGDAETTEEKAREDAPVMRNPDGTPMSKNQMKKARRAAAAAGQTNE